MNKKYELTPEQKADAARLKALWEARQPKISQLKFALENDLGTQGNVGHLLNARSPLNLVTATKFAKGLGVRIQEFSPSLAEKIEQASTVNTLESQAQRSIEESNVIETGRRIFVVPRISWVKAGGFEESNATDETCEPKYYVETTVKVSDRAFALTVDNDSMTDLDGGQFTFPEGMEIICDPDKECTVGSFVIAKDIRNQKTTFKKLTSDGFNLYLTPLNKRYAPILIDNENIRLIAKVVDTSQKLP